MKWAALILLIVTAALALYFLYFIGGMPGRVAAERGHPKADAIRVGGWATLIFGIVGWPWVLMWAYSNPLPEMLASASDESAADTAGDAE
jgi:hypothetical protein